MHIAVIGAGHAGIEAALAAARLGVPTTLFTLSLDGAIANLPCNPCIGGSAKGHLVKEIDALGGEMAKASDATFIQSRMLNRGKGPAIHSPRVQIDRTAYHLYMKHILETTDNLYLKQAEITDISVSDGHVTGVTTDLHEFYACDAVIIATGTYLHSQTIVGDVFTPSGPDGIRSADALSDSLKKLGIPMMRFKTGTPARINRRSIDFSELEEQIGDDPITPLSFDNADETGYENKVICHITYTNKNTHDIILKNLDRSPLYSGLVKGVGPRYCPSIEDKVVRFADKERHQFFVEPVALDSEEMYIQGFSSSMPIDVQLDMYHSVKGLENCEFMRPAYAIEYDLCDPTALLATLEFKNIKGLYGAGQFNGTSGYEEAAAQGLVAGINAARQVCGKEQIVFERSGSYIGTLIDDLVTKGTCEPYRMMTSRSEYRLLLRQDNADARLTPLGYEIGLVSEEKYQRYLKKQALIDAEIERVQSTTISPSKELSEYLVSCGTAETVTGAKLSDLIKRPQLSYKGLAPFDKGRPTLPEYVCEEVEITIKYEGYIRRQLSEVRENSKLENRKLPDDINYLEISGLRLEARQKLEDFRPKTLGQASRISGVNPADISVLLIYLETRR